MVSSMVTEGPWLSATQDNLRDSSVDHTSEGAQPSGEGWAAVSDLPKFLPDPASPELLLVRLQQ